MLSHAKGTGEHRVVLLALCAVSSLIEERPCCQTLPGNMEWSLFPQHHVCQMFLLARP